MSILRPEAVTHLAIHTIAFRGEATVGDIDRWHKERGWAGVGYHRYFRRDGRIYDGRPLNRVGAHVLGWNTQSIGYAFEGHGNFEDFTDEQKTALVMQAAQDYQRFPNLAIERILGHNEFRGAATECPGKKVDMDELRGMIRSYLEPEPALSATRFK